MLKAFAEFCDENDLRYYLYGGTLLGAVRHQ
ncbi:MAG TPA: LicD family protein, partial [Clostridiales bacterium]|nr:LicD family protein [Clostridiales bacterium]